MRTSQEFWFNKAITMINNETVSVHTDVFELTDTLISLEEERHYKDSKNDSLLDYNDTIISIEEVGKLETTDITVSGDNLFFCNNILTKNSWGTPQTADMLLAFTRTEELDKCGQILVKQLKNRYADMNKNKKFTIGIDISKMRLYDISDPTANIMNDTTPLPEVKQTPFMAGSKSKGNFKDFKM